VQENIQSTANAHHLGASAHVCQLQTWCHTSTCSEQRSVQKTPTIAAFGGLVWLRMQMANSAIILDSMPEQNISDSDDNKARIL
jgi:hypothetical protein